MTKLVFKGRVIEDKNGKLIVDGREINKRYTEIKPLIVGCIIGWLIVLTIHLGIS